MKIKFYCESPLKDSIPHPEPASKFIPQWYKSLQNDTSIDPIGTPTIKRCIPFLDSFRMGYIIPLWQDFHFSVNGDIVEYKWKTSLTNNKPISNHLSEQIEGSPTSKTKYGNSPMKFNCPWAIKTPPGYSCLFTNLINQPNEYLDLFSAVVDTDTYFNQINLPFVWKKENFSGYLQRGMPLVQVIPFRREEWDISVEELDKSKLDNIISTKKKLSTVFKKGYRNFFWQKKSFK